MKQVKEMLKFISESPTSFQAVDNIKKLLEKKGYREYNETNAKKITKGDKCYVTRNQTSIIAFNIGNKLNKPSINMVASHSDCPSYKVKPNAIIKSNGYVKLNTEGYGGMIKSTWLDRPLSLAGRVLITEKGKIVSRLINIDEDLMVIPSVAIHLSRDEQGKEFNQQVDMLPVISGDKDFSLNKLLAKELKVKDEAIISYDLYLYPRIKGYIWSDFISSHHLDNLECAYTSVVGFMQGEHQDNINVYACFDNEEVGSRTRQGAGSTFLIDVLNRIARDLGLNLNEVLSSSMMVSADNGHAIHPNHPEKADQTNGVKMNEGIVIKYNANQSYTSDALSSALFIECLKDSKIPYQYYTNRSDMAGGGTLGYVSSGLVSVLSVDIGLAQLAMHSTMETAGVKDVKHMINGLSSFYSTHIIKEDEATYRLVKQ